jgi:hypothetical protein
VNNLRDNFIMFLKNLSEFFSTNTVRNILLFLIMILLTLQYVESVTREQKLLPVYVINKVDTNTNLSEPIDVRVTNTVDTNVIYRY